MFEKLKNYIKHIIKITFSGFGVEIRLKSSLEKEAIATSEIQISPFPIYGILKSTYSLSEKPNRLRIDSENLSSSQRSIQERITTQKQFRHFLHSLCTGEKSDEDYQLMCLELTENLTELIDFAHQTRLPDCCRLFALRGSQIYYLFGDRYYSKDSPQCANLARSSFISEKQQDDRFEEGMTKMAIDYLQHPAFINIDHYREEIDIETTEKIQEINSLIEVTRIALSNPKTNPKTLLLEMVFQPIRQLFDAIENQAPDVERFPEFLDILYKRTVDGLCRDLAQSHYRGKYTGVISSPASLNISHTLEKKGFVLEKIPLQLLEKFNSLLTPYKEKIKANYSQGLTSRTALATNKIDKQVTDCLYNVLDRLGIIEGVSNYVGNQVRVGFALELSIPNSQWWRSRYSGFNCETQKTTYFHTDEAPEVPKAILYLSDVQEKNGPFTFIPDSYQWKRPALPWTISRVIDAMGNLMNYPDLPEDDSCDRHLLASSLGRQHFLLLPPSLRFVSHFGNDILTDSELEHYLRDRAYSVTSNTANCVIFDGGRLIHRGGLVQQGERWACQIVFVGDNSYANSLKSGLS